MSSEVSALDTFPGGAEMHSLIAAARQPSTQIFDRVLKAGADASSWTSKRVLDSYSPTISSLAISSPQHTTVEANVPMIPHLLSLGFDLNLAPLSTSLTCLTPVMSTFLTIDTPPVSPKPVEPPSRLSAPGLPPAFNLRAYTSFLSHASPSLTLTTPILAIHTFHLAVAHGSLPLLQHIMLYLATNSMITPFCCPYQSPFTCGLKVYARHAVTSLSSVLFYHPSWTRNISSPFHPPATKAEENYHTSQTALIDYVVLKLTQDVRKQDVFGNTSLHYLASHVVPNKNSISLLRAVEGGEEGWGNIRNPWGLVLRIYSMETRPKTKCRNGGTRMNEN
ncbi:uncharacterized protein BP5553_03589 [Venustampulla echinocandica]|uniref:Ankyrin repeat-containing protein n=1 Tax=Venustampulla echinocandica TaxID=2656787 RepID=A0A370TUQ3_9HELO|nr:uncharacterized protein BP5553_03589 [Venustampulla echinocandica]RDL39249.1 hypothetical protein BP5553_03589 [Venustampulla echinocandica]